jgi:hypothetical protein
MMTKQTFTRSTCFLLVICLTLTGFTAQVSATVVGTQEAISFENRAAQIADAEDKLAREDVQQAMIALGVDPAQARTRVSSLSDEELSRLNGQLDSLPAGGNEVLVIIGIVFLVLLILEVTGIVDIFSKIERRSTDLRPMRQSPLAYVEALSNRKGVLDVKCQGNHQTDVPCSDRLSHDRRYPGCRRPAAQLA